MKKSVVAVYHDNGYAPMPTINVSLNNFASCVGEEVVKKFNCTKELAERALNWAIEAAQCNFWEYWTEKGNLKEYFPNLAEKSGVYSLGRGGKHLCLGGLPPIDQWDAVMVSRWEKFEKDVLADCKYGLSAEVLLDAIEHNRWAEPDAEEFNFLERDGKTICFSDVPRCLHCQRKECDGQ